MRLTNDADTSFRAQTFTVTPTVFRKTTFWYQVIPSWKSEYLKYGYPYNALLK